METSLLYDIITVGLVCVLVIGAWLFAESARDSASDKSD
jgi:hypothetical protein